MKENSKSITRGDILKERQRVRKASDRLLKQTIEIVKSNGGVLYFDEDDGDDTYGMFANGEGELQEGVIRCLRVKKYGRKDVLYAYIIPFHDWLTHTHEMIDKSWENDEDNCYLGTEWNEVCANGDVDFYSMIMNIADTMYYYYAEKDKDE